MSKQNSPNEKFDKIARDLFVSAKLSGEEIEKVAAAPHLFASVKARIRAEQQARQTRTHFFDIFSNVWLILRKKRLPVSFALLIITTGLTALFFTVRQKPSESVEIASQPVSKPPTDAPAAVIADAPELTQKQMQTQSPALKNRPRTAAETAKIKPRESLADVKIRRTEKTAVNRKKQAPEVFYSLASAGNWESNGEDLRVVRAELSTSELFALGVNLPLANENPKIKTDLLVGTNGIPRAIRFVE